jgi:hypothetical protein
MVALLFRFLGLAVVMAIISVPLVARTDSSQNDIPSAPDSQEALDQRGVELGRAQVQRDQEQQYQLALIKAQADAAADAQIKVDQARAKAGANEAYEQSVAKAEEEYPDSGDSDTPLGKAIAYRFANMPSDDPLWDNPNRAEIIAKEEADKLRIKGKSESPSEITGIARRLVRPGRQ